MIDESFSIFVHNTHVLHAFSKNVYLINLITTNDQFSAEDLQKNTWNREIEILKRELSQFLDGHIIFEYTIPRIEIGRASCRERV